MSHQFRRHLVFAAAIQFVLLGGWFPARGEGEILKWIIVLLASGGIHLALSAKLTCGADATAFSKREIAVVLLIGAVMRVSVLPMAPRLSDDIYRHLWDGEVQLRGDNPYAAPPSEYAGIDELSSHIESVNHPSLRTIYPPLTQLISAAAVNAAHWSSIDPILIWKSLLLAIEMAGMVLFAAGLYLRGRAGYLPVYAWSPLAAVEFYASGHIDAAGVGLMAGSIGCLLLGRRATAGALFAAGVMTKWIVLPAAAGAARLKPRMKFTVAAIFIFGLLASPYLEAGGSAFETLTHYSRNWEFNGFLHRLLHVDAWGALPRRVAGGEFANLDLPGSVMEKSTGRVILAASAVAAGLLMACAGVSPEKSALTALGAFLLIQPVVYPWYLLNMMPLLVLQPYRPLLLLIALSPLSYEVLLAQARSGEWIENTALQSAAWIPPLLWMLIDLVRLRARRSGRT